MPRPRTTQELILWMEVGPGARWLRRTAVVLLIVVVSAIVAWKQFHGPASETTLLQADVGRQLASGAGFTTRVNYPQTAAFLAPRGIPFDPVRPYPEIHEAPLYSVVIAAALEASKLLPGLPGRLFERAPVSPNEGFGADYLLLGLNVALLWAAAALTYVLGRRLFSPRAGSLAALALLVSVAAWQRVVSLDGTPLLMVLALLAFLTWSGTEWGRAQGGAAAGASRSRAPWKWAWAALGLTCGALFLAEYSAGTLVLVALGSALLSPLKVRGAGAEPGSEPDAGPGAAAAGPGAPADPEAGAAGGAASGPRGGAGGGRALLGWRAALLVAAGFAAVTAPWVARNLALTGSPVGLALQNVALKAGDSTAEPSTARATLSSVLPRIDLNKLGNKGLTGLQEDVRSRLWSGGGLWLTGFFVAGALYRFRDFKANRMRWHFVVALGVLLGAQAFLNSGESTRLAAVWLSPLVLVFGAGFFFVLLESNPGLARWPGLCAFVLLVLQALPLAHDALEPRRLHFHYPPYFPGLLRGMRLELEQARGVGNFGLMADIPAGLAWYGGTRAWAQPAKMRDFYSIHAQQPLAELLLTPSTLDRPFFSDLNARPRLTGFSERPSLRLGEWGEVYAGLLTGALPREFPLAYPHKAEENLYVLINPAAFGARAR